MKKILSAVFLLALVLNVSAQKFITKTGHISFFSETPVENIDGHNKAVTSILDISTGQFVFSMSIREFKFEKQLMEDHFNEKYLESDKFPKAQFDGKISNLAAIDFSKDGTYDVTVSGKLTIHGVTRDITAKGKIIVKGKTIQATSDFQVKLVDHKIEVPTVVFMNIAESIAVKVDVTLQPYQ